MTLPRSRSRSRPRARPARPGLPTAAARRAEGQRLKLDRLVAFAKGHRRALVLTHDNPDPDALASAVALAYILEALAGVRAQVAFGGIVGRAENRAFLKVLKLPVTPISRVVFADHDLICMVDTQPEQGNHSLPPRHFPDVVIDHHPERPETRNVRFADVGGRLGATSTVLTEYIRASGLPLSPSIATALYYGIKADTRDLGRETTPPDVASYLWLFPQVDKEALTAIEHPRLPIEYFRLFHTAIERAQVYDGAVVCEVGTIYSPDMVAEVAERFLFLGEVKWSLAWAEYEGQLFFSLRTSDRRMNAGRLIREVIEARGGSAGGHGSMAGARVPLHGLSPAGRKKLEQELVAKFLKAFGVKGRRPRRIV